jgi:O-methyltransferase involved in polyketide biosynthesis
MIENNKYRLKDIQETLLLPLWGRAIETKKNKPIFIDEKLLKLLVVFHMIYKDFQKN